MSELPSTGRINKFDNLKGLAIFLIVLGHLTFFKKQPYIEFIWNIVFLIHLPVFFFVAGYFSKIGPDEPLKAFKTLFIPYILFCIIWELFSVYYLGDKPNVKLFISPGYMLWFLLCLFFMRLALPFMDRFKYPLIIAIIASLLIGFIDSNILGISRTCVYMPVFLLGFYYKDYKQKVLDKFPIIENNTFAIMVAILTMIASIILALTLEHEVICLKHMYSNDYLVDIIIRGIIILVSAINVLVLTRFMTNKKIILTQFGINSTTVYLFHPYVITIFKILFKPYFVNHHRWLIVFIFIMSFVIVYLLSRNILTQALKKVLNLIYRVLFIE
ncbi:acyltransferase family protein [Methanobrevibacter sp.]